jgi:hypothetical protein
MLSAPEAFGKLPKASASFASAQSEGSGKLPAPSAQGQHTGKLPVCSSFRDQLPKPLGISQRLRWDLRGISPQVRSHLRPEASGRAPFDASRSFHREFALFVKAVFSNLEGWKDWKDYLQ